MSHEVVSAGGVSQGVVGAGGAGGVSHGVV